MTENTTGSVTNPEMDISMISVIGPMDNNEVKLAEIELFNQDGSDLIADDFMKNVINPILSSMNL